MCRWYNNSAKLLVGYQYVWLCALDVCSMQTYSTSPRFSSITSDMNSNYAKYASIDSSIALYSHSKLIICMYMKVKDDFNLNLLWSLIAEKIFVRYFYWWLMMVFASAVCVRYKYIQLLHAFEPQHRLWTKTIPSNSLLEANQYWHSTWHYIANTELSNARLRKGIILWYSNM